MDHSNENLPLLPLTSGVLLPGMVFTMALESDEARAAAAAAGSAGGRLVIVPFIEGRYARIGVVAEVMENGELPGGLPAIAVRGLDRARLGTAVPGTGRALWVEVEVLDEGDPTEEAVELAREYRAVLENILLSRGAGRLAERLSDVTGPGRMADMSGYSPDLSLEQKVQVLETLDVTERLRTVIGWAREVLADLSLRERIKTDVEEGMEKNQREFLLRRQLDAIRRELGQISDTDEEAPDDYRSRIAGRDLPEAVRTAVEREIDKLERTSEQSPEQGWIRTWLDTLLEIPWGERSEDRLDIGEAARNLDADHEGLRDVKDRILEHLAVRKLQSERGLVPVGGRGAGAILALVGPPGVGKTSLGESVARALGRSFVRVALGGVRDEAEIRGHRRTYVGAQPGRLVRALRDAGTMNPVIVLDEVDKLGADYRGDPSSALLEVLDPAQNHTFRDHYLEVELDLSQVLFVATANMADTIPGPLLDRMEVIRLDGYTEDEKVAIARAHLVARQRERAALDAADVEITDDARPYRRGRLHTGGRRPLARARARPTAAQGGGPHRGRRQQRRDRPTAGHRRGRRPRLAGAPALLLRGGRPHRCARGGNRACGDRGRRGRPLRRGLGHGRPGGPDPDRSARRRDEGVRGDRPLLRALPRARARDRPRRPLPASGSTCTCRPVPSRRTAPRPGSPSPRRWSACCGRSRCSRRSG